MIKEIIGNATLYLGDCREILPSLSADAIVTDPPYGVGINRGDGRRVPIATTIEGDGSPPDLAHLGNGPKIIWGGNNFCDQLPRSTGWLVWHKFHHEKSQHSQAELAWTNVVRTIRHYQEAYHGFMRGRDGWFHPTQKPPGLMAWCLGFVPKAKVIADPYMGSGTTGIACAAQGREFIGVEINTEFFEVACRRIEDAHRQQPMFQNAT